MSGRRRVVRVEHVATVISLSWNQSIRLKNMIKSIPPKAGTLFRPSVTRLRRAANNDGRPRTG
eukprot:12931330-Prorocentrum_lima.AAC.1